MKKYLKPLFLSALLLMTGAGVFAQQDLKFGHINSNELLREMPERAQAQRELQREEEKLIEQLEQMQVEFNQKLQQFTEQQDTLTSLVKQMRERELNEIQERIRQFQMTAQDDLQRKQMELLQPIFDKIERAITKVAEEEGLIYVFDISGNSLLYYGDQSINIQPLVKRELGIE